MTWSKQKQRIHAHAHASALVARLFEDFQETDNVGPRFSWDKFPETVSRLAKVNCFTWFPEKVKMTKALENFAGGVAYNAAHTHLESFQRARESNDGEPHP